MWLQKGHSHPEKKGSSNGLVAVAIDKDKGSQYALKWATEHLLSRGKTVILIHVNPSTPPRSHQTLLLLKKLLQPQFTLWVCVYVIPGMWFRENLLLGAVDDHHHHHSDADSVPTSPYRQQLEKITRDLFLSFHCYCTRKDVSFLHKLLNETIICLHSAQQVQVII